MELASWFHTLIVSEVPCFNETSENAARRLISLVDVLYDHNVNLIVSAAAPPTNSIGARSSRANFSARRAAWSRCRPNRSSLAPIVPDAGTKRRHLAS